MKSFVAGNLVLAFVLGAAACTGDTGAQGDVGPIGPDGHATLVSTEAEPDGANCSSGGLAIHSGLDLDDDGTLDASEITATSYVCNGHDALVRIDDEPPGVSCAAGGKAIRTGVDDDGDGVLDPEEVDETTYVCNPEKRHGILVLQNQPTALTLLELNGGPQWTVAPAIGAGTVLADPDGSHILVSTSAGIEVREISTGTRVDTITPGVPAHDMVIVPSLGRLYVTGDSQVEVIDLATRLVITTLPYPSGVGAIAATPDGATVAVVAEGGAHVLFVDTASNAVIQDLTFAVTRDRDVACVGERVLTWDPGDGELGVYELHAGAWAEVVADRVPVGQGLAATNPFNVIEIDTAKQRLYIRHTGAKVLDFDPLHPHDFVSYTVSEIYRDGAVVDPEGGGLLGLKPLPSAAGFEHLSIPSGTLTSSPTSTATLGNANVFDLTRVDF